MLSDGLSWIRYPFSPPKRNTIKYLFPHFSHTYREKKMPCGKIMTKPVCMQYQPTNSSHNNNLKEICKHISFCYQNLLNEIVDLDDDVDAYLILSLFGYN